MIGGRADRDPVVERRSAPSPHATARVPLLRIGERIG
jgi:hypothetical protein